MKNIYEIQTKLKELGYYDGEINGVKDEVKPALMDFQRAKKLIVDGIYGPKTESILFKGEVQKLDLASLIFKAVPTCDKNLVRSLVPFLLVELDKIDVLNNDKRLAFFLGHCAIESAYYRTLREMGGIKYFESTYGTREKFSTARDTIPPRDKSKRGNLNYWYIGRGIIQNTWESNYKKVSDVVGIDFVKSPWLLETPEMAVKSATIFWKNNNLNSLADKIDYEGSTRKINGGTNHLAERIKYIKAFLAVLAGDDIQGVES